MIRKQIKNVPASVRQKLLNISRKDNRPFNELIQYYAMEGNPTEADKGFDAKCYNTIFEKKYPDTLFISIGGCEDIENSTQNIIPVIGVITKGGQIARLVDQDDNTPQEVETNRNKGIITLSRRNIESYLLDDEVLVALCKKENQENKIDQLLSTKKGIINNNDDLKPFAGQIYNEVKKILNLTQAGSNHKAFMRDILSPLITEDMTIYKELENVINQP